jgi:hypothetical protein
MEGDIENGKNLQPLSDLIEEEELEDDVPLNPLVELQLLEYAQPAQLDLKNYPKPPSVKDVLSKHLFIGNFAVAGYSPAAFNESHTNHVAATIITALVKGSAVDKAGNTISAADIKVNKNAIASIRAFPGLVVVFAGRRDSPESGDSFLWSNNTTTPVQGWRCTQFYEITEGATTKAEITAQAVLKKKVFFTPDDEYAVVVYIRRRYAPLKPPPAHKNSKKNKIPFYPKAKVRTQLLLTIQIVRRTIKEAHQNGNLTETQNMMIQTARPMLGPGEIYGQIVHYNF